MNVWQAADRRIALGGLVLLVLAVAACNFPQTVLQTASSVTLGPPTPTSIPEATRTVTPVPTPLPEDLVWYAPNMGSRDYAELFTNPEQWDAARARIDVFQFFSQNVLDAPCAICGDNTLHTFVQAKAFETLRSWGMPVAIEVSAVKEWGCTGVDEFRR